MINVKNILVASLIFSGTICQAADTVIFSDNPMSSWITTSELKTKDVEYYLNPQGLHKNPDSNWYQLGVTKVFKPGGKMLFDLQISGCKKGKGFYRRGDNGDFWLKPMAWRKNGNSIEDRLASVACEITLDCERIVSLGQIRKKSGGREQEVESRFYRAKVSPDSMEYSCGRSNQGSNHTQKIDF